MMELTIEQLKEMKPGIFATGTGTYPEIHQDEVRWVAVRGEGMHDWCIYALFSNETKERIKDIGQKVINESVIKRLVPCNDEAWQLYRY